MYLQLSSNLLCGAMVKNRALRASMRRIGVVTVMLIAGMLLSVASANAVTKTSGAGARSWNTAASWSPSGVPANGDDVVIPSGSTVTLNATTNTIASLNVSGTLGFGDGTARTLTVSGNVTVASTGTITINNFNDTHPFYIGGNLVNNGVFDMDTATDDLCYVVFNGTANQTVSGTGGTTNFYVIAVYNTGAANNNIVEISSTNFTVNAPFLFLVDGIFKVSGTFALNNAFLIAAAGNTIPANTGIWLNNANATVTAQNADVTLNGLIRVTAGTYNVGSVANVDLLYGNGAQLTIEGGALNIAGALSGVSSPTAETVVFNMSGGTMTVTTLDNTSGSRTNFDIPIAGSSFTMSGGTIVIQRRGTGGADEYDNGAGTLAITGGTVQFGNASTPAGSTFLVTAGSVFPSLSINTTNSPTVQLVGPVTVRGNVSINAGATLNANSQAIIVTGNSPANPGHWTKNGTFTPGTQTTTFNGTSGAQTISGSTATGFSSLTISNAAGVSLSGVDATVNAVLSLNSGDLTTGANFLNMAVGATSTGTPAPGTDVVGNVRRSHTFATGTSYAFGNQFVSLNFTAAGTKPTAVNINLVKAAPSGANFEFSTAVQRTYTVTPTGGTGYSATLRLHYLNSELNGNNETSANFDLWRHNGVDTWQRQVKTGNDAADTANWAEKSGVTQFSAWTLAGGSGGGPGPTAVRLTRFNAVSFADGVRLNWESGYEVNNLGFHVYREQNGQRSRVTPSVVAGSALTVGQGNRLTAGYSYSWFDHQGTPGTAYHLEAIDLNGARQWAGPVYPYADSSAGMGRKGSALGGRAMLLTELAGTSSGQTAETGWPTSMSAVKNAERWVPVKPNPLPLAVQQKIAAGVAVKIQVRKTGWYRVTQSDLVATGLDSTADSRWLQLYVDGQEVPLRLSSDGPALSPDDTMEFYGVALDTPTSDTRTYWLINGNTPGKRISAKRNKIGDYYWTGNGRVRSFDHTTERREKLIYSSFLQNGDAENIFGELIFSEPVTQVLEVSHLDGDAAARGTQPVLEVALQGLSAQSHTVEVQLNGASIGTINFAGSEHPVEKFSFDRSLLVDGDNVVSLRSTNGEADVSFIDWIRLTYARQYIAANDALAFSAPAGRTVKVEGFTTSDLRVIDVTNPNSPLELHSLSEPSGSGFAVRVLAADSQRTLLAFANSIAQRPASLLSNEPSSWNAKANGADMVIVTHKKFRAAIEPLANLRRSQGLVVAVVDVEDVYDEFSYGAHTPAAIKNFLMSAAVKWSRKPRYLLLVGDSSWDPRNYLNEGDNDFVPTKLIDTAAMETASDDWLADFNGSGLADMAIGRLPARTATEVDLMVRKIMSFEQERELNVPLRGAVMVADSGFEVQSAETGALLPPSVGLQTINRSEGNDDVTRGQIVDALNQGPMIVNYYGHGSVSVWTGAGLLDSDLASNLTNTNRLSLYVMMTCLNGYAHDVYIDSLAESALKAPNGGAVAVWASSGFTEAESQIAMDQEFYRHLFNGQPVTLGEAIRNAKAGTGDNDVRRTWLLFGDPAMRMR